MFDDNWGRKQALLDYKNFCFERSPYWDFFKGVNPWLCQQVSQSVNQQSVSQPVSQSLTQSAS